MSHKNKNVDKREIPRHLYPTPNDVVEDMVLKFIPKGVGTYVDFGTGDSGVWANAVKRHNPNSRVIGLDIFYTDESMIGQELDGVHYELCDISTEEGFLEIVSKYNLTDDTMVIGNPPFFGQKISKTSQMLKNAFCFKKAALLLPLDYTTGKRRSKIYRTMLDSKPAFYNLNPRIDFTGQGGNDNNNTFMVTYGGNPNAGQYFIYEYDTGNIY